MSAPNRSCANSNPNPARNRLAAHSKAKHAKWAAIHHSRTRTVASLLPALLHHVRAEEFSFLVRVISFFDDSFGGRTTVIRNNSCARNVLRRVEN